MFVYLSWRKRGTAEGCPWTIHHQPGVAKALERIHDLLTTSDASSLPRWEEEEEAHPADEDDEEALDAEAAAQDQDVDDTQAMPEAVSSSSG